LDEETSSRWLSFAVVVIAVIAAIFIVVVASLHIVVTRIVVYYHLSFRASRDGLTRCLVIEQVE